MSPTLLIADDELLLARVLIPGPAEHEDAVAAIDRWRIEEIDSAAYVVVFTSPDLLTAHLGGGVDAAWLKFTQLIAETSPSSMSSTRAWAR